MDPGPVFARISPPKASKSKEDQIKAQESYDKFVKNRDNWDLDL